MDPGVQSDEEVANKIERPVARAFDLVLHEYPGYTDETLLDVTLGRFKQMVSVIMERKIEEMRRAQKWDLKVAELVVSSIGGLLAGLAQSKKAHNSMVKAADSVDFVRLIETAEEREARKEESMPSTGRVMQMFGVRGDGLAGVRG